MFTLIIGGSASGKSSYAERLTVSLPGDGPRIYLATMEAFGAEAQARIARHRQMRRGRGFETLECTRNLTSAQVPPGSNVLLEDMGNLVANELFGEPVTVLPETITEETDIDSDPVLPETISEDIDIEPDSILPETITAQTDISSKILTGVEQLRSRSAHLTIVTNDVFSAGNEYEGDTDRYLRVLADVNRALAARADKVVEVVCGQPVVLSDLGKICADAANLCESRSNRRNCLNAEGSGCRIHHYENSENPGTESGEEAGMFFVTGPLYAGKQAYIMQALGWNEAEFAANGVRDVQELAAEAVQDLRDLHTETGTAAGEAANQANQADEADALDGDILRERLAELADELAGKKVVIATEVGGGVVPMDPVQRREREAAGRLSCLLAERAQRVIRVCCGLPQILK